MKSPEFSNGNELKLTRRKVLKCIGKSALAASMLSAFKIPESKADSDLYSYKEFLRKIDYKRLDNFGKLTYQILRLSIFSSERGVVESGVIGDIIETWKNINAARRRNDYNEALSYLKDLYKIVYYGVFVSLNRSEPIILSNGRTVQDYIKVYLNNFKAFEIAFRGAASRNRIIGNMNNRYRNHRSRGLGLEEY